MLRLIVEGRMSEPREYKVGSDEKRVLNFSVAYEYRKKDEDRTLLCTDWVQVSVWNFKNTVYLNGQSVSPELLLKGRKVRVEGIPVIDSYTDPSTGEVKSGLKIIANRVNLFAN